MIAAAASSAWLLAVPAAGAGVTPLTLTKDYIGDDGGSNPSYLLHDEGHNTGIYASLTPAAATSWAFVSVGSGWYQIVDQGQNLCMTWDKSQGIVMAESTASNQNNHWKFVAGNPGFIENQATGAYLHQTSFVDGTFVSVAANPAGRQFSWEWGD